ncbi:MAG: hypothetical protein MUC59_05420 [Saprospiraceae bacterium]|nr:hypothetical protein [Saprospiraceae bacterium]
MQKWRIQVNLSGKGIEEPEKPNKTLVLLGFSAMKVYLCAAFGEGCISQNNSLRQRVFTDGLCSKIRCVALSMGNIPENSFQSVIFSPF